MRQGPKPLPTEIETEFTLAGRACKLKPELKPKLDKRAKIETRVRERDFITVGVLRDENRIAVDLSVYSRVSFRGNERQWNMICVVRHNLSATIAYRAD